MKLTEEEKSTGMCILMIIVLSAMIFLAAIVTGCSSNTAKANTNVPENELLKYKHLTSEQEELLRAYNHLLHRVWVDKPVYVEECLSETDEFIELYNLLDGNWADTFSFYNEEDSIAYNINWANESPYDPGCTRVVKHIVIPEPSKSRIRSVFGITGDE